MADKSLPTPPLSSSLDSSHLSTNPFRSSTTPLDDDSHVETEALRQILTPPETPSFPETHPADTNGTTLPDYTPAAGGNGNAFHFDEPPPSYEQSQVIHGATQQPVEIQVNRLVLHDADGQRIPYDAAANAPGAFSTMRETAGLPPSPPAASEAEAIDATQKEILDLALWFLDEESEPPSLGYQQSRLPQSVAIPAQTGDGIGFPHVWTKSLDACDVPERVFVAFIDGLNALCALAHAPGAPLLTVYLARVNAAIFHPRGLRVTIADTADLLPMLAVPPTNGTREAVTRQIRTAGLESAGRGGETAEATRRLKPLEPWTAPLRFVDARELGEESRRLWMAVDGLIAVEAGEQEQGVIPPSQEDDTSTHRSQPSQSPPVPQLNQLPLPPRGPLSSEDFLSHLRQLQQRPKPPQIPQPPLFSNSSPWLFSPDQPSSSTAHQRNQSWEEWGTDFGKRMETWGENFGKQMEAWGKTVEERANRPQRSYGAESCSKSSSGPSSSGNHGPTYTVKSAGNKVASPHVHGDGYDDDDDDDSSSISSSDSESSDDESVSGEIDVDIENMNISLAKKLSEIEAKAQAARQKGKKAEREIERERVKEILKAEKDHHKDVQKMERQRLKRIYKNKDKGQKRALKRELRARNREMMRDYRERRRRIREEVGDSRQRKQMRQELRAEKREQRGIMRNSKRDIRRGASTTDSETMGECWWIVVDQLPR